MVLNDKQYNLLKWIVGIVLPASIALIGTVGGSFDWQYTELAMTITGAVTTFLGATLGISNVNYNKEGK